MPLFQAGSGRPTGGGDAVLDFGASSWISSAGSCNAAADGSGSTPGRGRERERGRDALAAALARAERRGWRAAVDRAREALASLD